jgi:hypothetical protein
MVKIPQSSFGYCVDGRVVCIPRTRRREERVSSFRVRRQIGKSKSTTSLGRRQKLSVSQNAFVRKPCRLPRPILNVEDEFDTSFRPEEYDNIDEKSIFSEAGESCNDSDGTEPEEWGVECDDACDSSEHSTRTDSFWVQVDFLVLGNPETLLGNSVILDGEPVRIDVDDSFFLEGANFWVVLEHAEDLTVVEGESTTSSAPIDPDWELC